MIKRKILGWLLCLAFALVLVPSSYALADDELPFTIKGASGEEFAIEVTEGDGANSVVVTVPEDYTGDSFTLTDKDGDNYAADYIRSFDADSGNIYVYATSNKPKKATMYYPYTFTGIQTEFSLPTKMQPDQEDPEYLVDIAYWLILFIDKSDASNPVYKLYQLSYVAGGPEEPPVTEEPLLLDAEIHEGNGQWMMKSDLFQSSKNYSANIAVPYGGSHAVLALTTETGVTVSVNGADTQTVGESGKIDVSLNSSVQGAANSVSLTSGDNAQTYTVTCYTQKYSGMPDSVVDYLCIGSQYTNGKGISDYGLRGVATLLGSNEDAIGDSTSGPASLGNFGGYITYYYEDALYDDPKNPYGVEFITFGNSVEGSGEFAEPGQVWVSENGADWYALAGALHYDNCALWDYSITYTPASDGKHSSWSDSLGRSAVQPYYEYPLASYYPLHTFADGDESSTTFSGILLEKAGGVNEYGNTLPPFPDFGYTDVGQKLTMLEGENAEDWTPEERQAKFARNIAGNPYRGSYVSGNRIFLSATDGMDLAWAVDSDGQPVSFPDGIHYVKIVTANNIDNGAIGEKSTEVNMVRVAAAGGSAVGKTAGPAGITVDGKALALTSGKYVYDDVVVDGPFAVAVDAPEDANVYINSTRGHKTVFNAMPDHQMLRIVVQEEEKEPVIYYLNIRETADTHEAYATLTLDPNGGTVDGSATPSTYTFDAHMSDIDLPTPANSNKNLEFAGWYFGQNIYMAYPSKVENITLTARWGTVGTPTPTNIISVSFRLIGSTLAELEDEYDTIDLADGDYKGAEYVNWIATRNYTMHEGDTVYDLFTKALNNAGLRSVGAAQGYVRTIYAPAVYGGYALGEFTNGKNSGWMYTIKPIDGETRHPLFGLKEQELTDGDKVIWHYVNDYAYEVHDWAALGGSGYPALGDGRYYNKWLEAEDINPTSDKAKIESPTVPPGQTTPDDKALQEALKKGNQAKLSLEDKTDGKAYLSSNTLKTVNETKPLLLENNGVQVEFPAGSLLTGQFSNLTADGQAQVELGVKEADAADQAEILAKAKLGESTGLFSIGGKILEFTAEVARKDEKGEIIREKVGSFNEPVKVTIDLSGANLSEQDIAELCAVRYEKDEAGHITPVKLGGTYDPITKQFTFYTDTFSYYGVVRAAGLVQISLGINRLTVQVNGKQHYLDVPASLIDNRTMVPLRFVAEALGAQTGWSAADRSVSITQGGQTLKLTVDQPGPGLDVPATIRNGRTLVPLRYVAESLGAHVTWHPAGQRVEIVK